MRRYPTRDEIIEQEDDRRWLKEVTKETQPMSDTLPAGAHRTNSSGNCSISGCPCRGWSAQETAKEVDECQSDHPWTNCPKCGIGICGEHMTAWLNHQPHQPAARGGGGESKRYLLAERVRFHRLFVAVKAMRIRHRETAKKSNFNDCGCDDCLLLQPILTVIEHYEQRSTPQ